GTEYDGLLNTTISGRKCQRWDSQYPHDHTSTATYNFPSNSIAHNYCRNPSNDPLGPWCYTTDPTVRWEYCFVLYC
ncbi:hypothetical protein CAPTEDRAFT_50131, partial [Capitella teleta]